MYETTVTKTVCSKGSKEIVSQLSMCFGKKWAFNGSIGYEIYQAYNEPFRVSATGGNEKTFEKLVFRSCCQVAAIAEYESLF